MRRRLVMIGLGFLVVALLTIPVWAGARGPLTLAWDAVTLDANDNATTILYYAVRWGTSSGAQNSGFTVNGDVTQVTVQGLDPGQVYWFKVYAINTLGEGLGSNEVQGRPSLVIHR